MIRASWFGLAVAVIGAVTRFVAGADASSPQSTPAKPTVTLGAGNFDRLAKTVRSFYANYEVENRVNLKANKDLVSLREDAGKLAKDAKFNDPLLAVEDWREIVKRGFWLEKPLSISAGGELRPVEIPSPMDLEYDEKALAGIFDKKLKAFVSVPADYKKVAYPVILALYPMDDEVKALKNLAKSKVLVDKVKAWATATYSKELLAKAIVVAPVMDLALSSSDGVAYFRPRWDSDDGALWAIKALNSIVFRNLNCDLQRIFIDGEGTGTLGALLFCSRFPGIQTGAIVRGTPPQKIDFGNCLGSPVLFVGADAKEFYDTWKAQDGFVLEHKETLDDASLLAWMEGHPKQFAPKKVSLETDLHHARSFWIRVTDEDPTKEKLPIKLDAAVDSEKNEITVVTNEKVTAFEVFLNDKLVDLSKPVRVVHRWAGNSDPAKETVLDSSVKRVMEYALAAAYENEFFNTGEIYVAKIRVELGTP